MAKLDIPERGAGALIAPGVFDALSALLAERAGARAVYISGASVSYTQFGAPDLGFVDLTRIADVCARVAQRVGVPVIVDADTGFGNAVNVQHTMRTLERAGASAIQLEDQSMPKRCGHLSGKALVSCGEMVGKIAAALDARAAASTLVIARTDAVAVEGVDRAFERAHRYIEAGADVLFIEALRTVDEMRRAADLFGARTPLVANMVEGGRTPMRTAKELADMGFRIVICPGALARAFTAMAEEFLHALLRDGSSAGYAARMRNFDEINMIVGLPDIMEAGARYDPAPKEAAE